MILQSIAAAGIVLITIVLYLLMSRVYRRFHYIVLMPIITVSFILVVTLVSLDIPYDTYMQGGKFINLMLGPAVVSLAYPLYQQRETLVKNFIPIVTGVVVGLIGSIITGIYFTQMLSFSPEILYAQVPKSITTAVAMQISNDLGGIPTLTAIFVMIAGFTGVFFSAMILKLLKIDHFVARGVGIGTASHVIGTATSYEYGLATVSVSSVAMTLSAIIGSFLAPAMVWLYLAWF